MSWQVPAFESAKSVQQTRSSCSETRTLQAIVSFCLLSDLEPATVRHDRRFAQRRKETICHMVVERAECAYQPSFELSVRFRSPAARILQPLCSVSVSSVPSVVNLSRRCRLILQTPPTRASTSDLCSVLYLI